MASQHGDVEGVKQLLSSSAGHSDEVIVAALMLACQNGHSDVVELIIRHGTQVDSPNDDGQSALIVASQNGHSEVVKLLLDHGAQVDIQDHNGMSSLMMASQNGHHDTTEVLLARRVQVDLQNNDGWSALMFAIWKSHIKIAETLLEHGARVNKDFLDKISSSKHSEVLGILNKQLGNTSLLFLAKK